MEIEGKPLELLIQELNDELIEKEQKLLEQQELLDKNELNLAGALTFDIIMTQAGIRMCKEKIIRFKLLQLTEEKRRLLTCIIEWMTKAVAVSGLRGDTFFRIAELHKRVNLAETTDELAKISDELIEFKKTLLESE